jgi:replicative DNA helicase
MVTLQIINKILQSGDISIISKNALTEEYFVGYEPEFNFIIDHFNKYGKVPDKATFLDKFNDFNLVEVAETDKYLLDTLYEEHLYYKSVEVVQKVAELLKTNANDAVEYLHSQLPNLQIATTIEGTDIIKQADERYKIYLEKMNADNPWYITTGFEELDDILNGWAKGEELIVLFARTGQGKSWVLAKTLTHAWQIGNRVGYISPEMSPTKIGYRFDTLLKNFSNRNLVWGKEEPGYQQYIDDLKTKENPFIVATPLDFQKKVTVTKLKHFCQTNKLDILGIDGITYLTDERYKKGDNKTISLTNISEDLMALSIELGIPILVVVQSNRGGVKNADSEGTPELENIRDSDGIAQNATKVIALRQTGAGLEFGIKKHRDGINGGKLIYYWDIDRGQFQYIPSSDDAAKPEIRNKRTEEIKNSFNDGTDVF